MSEKITVFPRHGDGNLSNPCAKVGCSGATSQELEKKTNKNKRNHCASFAPMKQHVLSEVKHLENLAGLGKNDSGQRNLHIPS